MVDEVAKTLPVSEGVTALDKPVENSSNLLDRALAALNSSDPAVLDALIFETGGDVSNTNVAMVRALLEQVKAGTIAQAQARTVLEKAHASEQTVSATGAAVTPEAVVAGATMQKGDTTAAVASAATPAGDNAAGAVVSDGAVTGAAAAVASPSENRIAAMAGSAINAAAEAPVGDTKLAAAEIMKKLGIEQKDGLGMARGAGSSTAA